MKNLALLGTTLAVIAMAARASTARAASLPTAVLELHATAAPCATEGDLRRAITEKFGYDPFREHAPVTVSITVAADGVGGYHGTFALRDQDGHELGRRVVEDARCESVRETLVLTVSLALDPLGPTGRTLAVAPRSPADPPSPPETVTVDPPVLAPAVDRVSRATSTTRRPPSFRVAVGAEIFSGVGPGTVPGFHGSLGVRSGRWGLDVEGGATAAGSSGNAFGSAQGSVAVGSLVPCYRAWSSRAFAIDGCVVATGGVLFSRGANVAVETSRTDPVGSANARLQAEWRFAGSLGVVAFAEGGMELVRSELSVADAGAPHVVWRTPPAAANAGLSLFALIP